MRITVEYAAQLKRAAGTASEDVQLPTGTTIREVIAHVATQHGNGLQALLLDSTGNPQRSLLIFLGDDQHASDSELVLNESDVVTILTPISGG